MRRLPALLACLAAFAPATAVADWPDGAVDVAQLAEGTRIRRPTFQAAPDGRGGALVLPGGANGGVLRVGASGATQLVWPPAGGSALGALAACDDGEGGTFLALSGAGAGLRLLKLDPSDAPVAGWSASGVAIVPDGTPYATPLVCPNGAGGAFVVWPQRRADATYDLRAAYTNATGGVTRLGDGHVGGTPAGIFRLSRLVPDGRGGALLSWLENPSLVYAQRLAPGAVPLWGGDGLGVSVGSSIKYDARIAPDGQGGAYFAWEDYRVSDFDPQVYGAHVAAGGALAPGWAADGSVLAGAGGHARVPAIAADGSGGFWMLSRDASYNVSGPIYVTRFAQGPGGPVAWSRGPLLIGSSSDGSDYLESARAGAVHPLADGAFLAWTDGTGAQALRIRGDGSTGAAWSAPLATSAVSTASQPALTGSTDGGVLFFWLVRGSLPAGPGEVRTSNAVLGMRLDDAGTLDAPAGGDARFGIRGVAPQPAREGWLRVRFALAGGAPAGLALLDLQGRTVARSAESGDGVRERTLALPAGLAPGLYVLRLEQAGRASAARVLVLR